MTPSRLSYAPPPISSGIPGICAPSPAQVVVEVDVDHPHLVVGGEPLAVPVRGGS